MSRRKEKGASVTETILVLPLLVFITLGIIQTAHLYTSYQIVEYAAITAARSAMVYPPRIPENPTLDDIKRGVDTNWEKVVMTAKVASIPATPSGNKITEMIAKKDDAVASIDLLLSAVNSVLSPDDQDLFLQEMTTKTLYSMLATWVEFELCKDGAGGNLDCKPIDKDYEPKSQDRLKVTVYYVYDLKIPFIRRVFAEIYYRVLADKVVAEQTEESGYILKEGTGYHTQAALSIINFISWLEQLTGSFQDMPDGQEFLARLDSLHSKLEGEPAEIDEDYLFTLDDLVDSTFDDLMDLFETWDFYPIVLRATAGTVVMPQYNNELEGETI